MAKFATKFLHNKYKRTAPKELSSSDSSSSDDHPTQRVSLRKIAKAPSKISRSGDITRHDTDHQSELARKSKLNSSGKEFACIPRSLVANPIKQQQQSASIKKSKKKVSSSSSSYSSSSDDELVSKALVTKHQSKPFKLPKAEPTKVGNSKTTLPKPVPYSRFSKRQNHSSSSSEDFDEPTPKRKASAPAPVARAAASKPTLVTAKSTSVVYSRPTQVHIPLGISVPTSSLGLGTTRTVGVLGIPKPWLYNSKSVEASKSVATVGTRVDAICACPKCGYMQNVKLNIN